MPEHVDELEPVLKLNPDFVLTQLLINNFETPGMRRPSRQYPLLPADLNARLTDASLVTNCWPIAGGAAQESLGLVDTPAILRGTCETRTRPTPARPSASCVNSPAAPGLLACRRGLSSSPPRTRWARTASVTLWFHPRPCTAICAEERIVFVDLLAPLQAPATRAACGSARSTPIPTPWRTNGPPPGSSMRSRSRGAADSQHKKKRKRARGPLPPNFIRRGSYLKLDACRV